MSRWPRDTEPAQIAFYGTPGADVERHLVDVIPPFRMTYEGKPVARIKFHEKAAPALRAALQKIRNYYGNQAQIDKLGISKYAGAYNPRKISGSNRWSNHAFGAAIDLDSERNGFNTGHGTMPLPVVAAFKSEGARWGGEYKHRTDPMHFEFCENGEEPRTFDQWLEHYGCAASPAVAKPAPAPVTKPARIQPEDGPPSAPPKSMATSKIGNAQIAAGTITTVAAGAEVVKPLLETTHETVQQVSDIATQTGTIVETTKVVVTSVPHGFWSGLVQALTSPPFIACAVLVVLATCVLTWYWRRQHRKAGV